MDIVKFGPEYHYQSPDFVPFEIGVTYTFPIFITNSTFGSDCYDGKVNMMVEKIRLRCRKMVERGSK